MPSFQYRAYDAIGALVQGRIEAASRDAASEALWSQGLMVFQLKDLGQNAQRWWQRELFGGHVRSGDLTTLTRAFATLASAGIPLDDCLRILMDQATSIAVRETVGDLRRDVLDGAALSDALQKRPRTFSGDYVNIVKAGESAGSLAPVLDELAALLDRRDEVRAKIRSALVYPGILLVLSAVSLAVIIGVLIPNIAPVFAQSGKPLPSTIQFLVDLQSQWLNILLGSCIVASIGTWSALFALRRTGMRLGFDRFKLRVPIAGDLLLGLETARFSRTLGTLLRAGVPMTHAAASACSAVSNRHLGWGLEHAINQVREGRSLNAALSSEAALPAIAMRMISVGEEAGKLDHMLLTIAAMFEQQTQRNIDRLMTLLTPLLTIAIAILVGSLVMAVMNAVLSINEIAVR